MQDGSALDQQSQENAISYELYTRAGATAEELEDLRLQCLAAVLPYLTGYIWQQDPFSLHNSIAAKSLWSKASLRGTRSKADESSVTAKLWGVTRFGDNIEDEWLIVWLLYQITLKFSDVSVRVWDNDGDFLLIEAAYSLPKWLKPETSNNRVWIQAGQLHIIPLPTKHYPTLPATPTIQQALQILSSDSVNTKANASMQEAIRAKIKGYPRKAQAEMHRARCLLPAKIAHVLQQKLQLVSPAVRTFHYRDVQDMRAAAKLASFPPEDLVTVIVPFNRALYAQLAQQQFQPPRGYPLPPPASPAFKAADLGMKLTCGFEMVMAKQTLGQMPQGPQLDAAALKDNPQWAAFKGSLAKNGYFKGNIPDSAQYKTLLAEAVQSFAQSEVYQQSADAAAAPAEAIAAILQQPVDLEQFKDGPEDDDAWMTGGAADLEAELAQRQRELEGDVAKRAKRTAQGLGATDLASEFDPSEMVSKLNAFVNQTSGHEGAEVPSDIEADVSLNDPAFWRELKSALGVAADKHGIDLDQLSDTGSSTDGFDDDGGSSSSGSEASISRSEMHKHHSHCQQSEATRIKSLHPDPGLSGHGHGSSAQHKDPLPHVIQRHVNADAAAPVHADHNDTASEVMTATDSDDEDTAFMDAYDQALADELASSRVGSIINPKSSTSAATGDQAETPEASAEAEQPAADDLKPVDLDTNLVRNLLQSYTAQQGLAGPAGNLAGLLGLDLPDHAQDE